MDSTTTSTCSSVADFYTKIRAIFLKELPIARIEEQESSLRNMNTVFNPLSGGAKMMLLTEAFCAKIENKLIFDYQKFKQK